MCKDEANAIKKMGGSGLEHMCIPCTYVYILKC